MTSGRWGAFLGVVAAIVPNNFPLTLLVAFNYRTEIRRQTFAAPGDFELSVPLEAVLDNEDEWLVLKLNVVGRTGETNALVLNELRFAP